MANERTSLTSAVYHLQMYNIYMEDFKRDCRLAAKHDAGKWLSKGECLMNDIYSTMTPESKEIFERELKRGDVLFFPSISEKLMKMEEHQRTFVETVCDMLLKGEKIELLEENKY